MYNHSSKIHTYVRPHHNRNKFHSIEEFYKVSCKFIEQFIMDYFDKLARKTENTSPVQPPWIYNIRPKKFDSSFLFWYIAKPPDTVFHRLT